MTNPGRAAVETFATAVTQRYVFADLGVQIAARIREVGSADDPAEDLATSLTTAAQSVNTDRHLCVRRRPASQPATDSDWRRYYADEARGTSGGIQTVTRMDARTGLIAIAPYSAAVDLAEPYVRAAFTLLTGVERLVLDLREGHGGTPETVALICGYLLARSRCTCRTWSTVTATDASSGRCLRRDAWATTSRSQC